MNHSQSGPLKNPTEILTAVRFRNFQFKNLEIVEKIQSNYDFLVLLVRFQIMLPIMTISLTAIHNVKMLSRLFLPLLVQTFIKPTLGLHVIEKVNQYYSTCQSLLLFFLSWRRWNSRLTSLYHNQTHSKLIIFPNTVYFF